jgi:uncharacterized protein (DUF58 family)
MVKQFQQAGARDTMICLDMTTGAYRYQTHEAIEQAIVVAASLVRHIAVVERLSVGLRTEAYDPAEGFLSRLTVPPRSDSGQLQRVLEVLARVEGAPQSDFSCLLQREAVDLSLGSTIIAVTGSLNGTIAESLLHLRRAGHAPAVILVQPRTPHHDEFHAGGVPVYRVWDDGDLAVAL